MQKCYLDVGQSFECKVSAFFTPQVATPDTDLSGVRFHLLQNCARLCK